VALMVVGYALLELALVVLAVPILVAEAALLVSLAWARESRPRVPAAAGLEQSANPRAPAVAANGPVDR